MDIQATTETPTGIVCGDESELKELREDTANSDRVPRIRKTKGFSYDPEKTLDDISKIIETRVANVDAKIFEGSPRTHKWQSSARKHYPTLATFMESATVRRRIRDKIPDTQLKDTLDKLQESFANEPYPDEVVTSGGSNRVFSTSDLSVPGFFGPQARQMTLFDVLDAQRKCFEAATRNPVGKRIAKIIPQFVLSRGVRGSHNQPEYQAAWNEFWKAQKMAQRTKSILRELVIYGEIFLRYFKLPAGLAVRSLDPSTIWEIVTNPDDIEEVYYYHQQYVTLNQNLYLTDKNVPPSTLIIRQIPGADIDHYKINATSHEKRGRSELYAILPWLMRFRDFVNDRVVLNKMRAMFAMDVSVDGGNLDLAMAEQQFATPPGSGSVLIHNKKVAVEFKNANTNANESKTDSEMLLKIIAVGAGVSEQFLGVSYGSNRAGALIQTEPDVKNFEDYREIVEHVLSLSADRVFTSKGLKPPVTMMEFTFPSIASEDRSAKVKDIALAEAMDYFSKKRSSTMVAREFDVSNFDHDQEQQQIRQERADEPVMAQGYQQVDKIAPNPLEVAAAMPQPGGPGMGTGKPGPVKKAQGSGKAAVKYAGAQGGFPSDGGGRGLPGTKATANRPQFSRGKEKNAIKNNRSSDTPKLRETEEVIKEGEEDTVFLSRRGFTDQARVNSIIERKRRRAARLMRMAEQVQEEAKKLDQKLTE